MGKNEKIILFLIYDTEDNIVGKARLVFEGGELVEDDTKVNVIQRQNNLDVQASKADGISLTGIVVEDTKTKPESDFYKEFYSDYLSKNINGKFIVTIKEVLAIGRNTKIEVLVANTKVLEFIVRPSMAYLREMKNYAILRVIKQLELMNKNQNTVQHYWNHEVHTFSAFFNSISLSKYFLYAFKELILIAFKSDLDILLKVKIF